MIKNYIVVGLGNPGEEYVGTRHNLGFMTVDALAKELKIKNWVDNPKIKGLCAEGRVGQAKVLLVKPQTFMNKSGETTKGLLKGGVLKMLNEKVNGAKLKTLSNLVVVNDDLDLPLGKMKISFSKSSGGHRGVESIVKAVGTEAFVRLRLGISGETASGKIKKPQGEEKVIDTILGKFKPSEEAELKKTVKRAVSALELIIEHGWEKGASLLGTIK